jgi:hypothetical protein
MSSKFLMIEGPGCFLANQTALGRRVWDWFGHAQENRRDTELMWNANLLALEAKRGSTPDGHCSSSEAEQSWQSDDVIPFCRMKLRAAKAVGENVVLKASDVPLRAKVPDSIRQAVEQAGQDPAAIEADARRELVDLLSDTGAARQLLMLWTDGARFGESISHATEARQSRNEWELAANGEAVEVAKTVRLPGCERVDLFECFRDMEYEQIEEGAYFFRAQPADMSAIAALVRKPPERADADEVEQTPLFSQAAVVRALDQFAAGTKQGMGEDTASDESEAPERRKPLKRQRSGTLIEAWLHAPRKEVERFLAHWKRDAAIDTGASRDKARIDHVSAAGGADAALEPIDEADTMLVQVFLANGEIVGFNADPGRITYHREIWEDHENGIDGFGVVEAARPFQRIVTGQTRAFMDNSKLLANFVLAVQRLALKTRVEDVFKAGGILEIEADEDVRKAVQQLTFTDVTGPLLRGIEMFLHFGDLATQMPREFHGQQPEYESTAFEVGRRLEQAGKYIISVARRFDGHINFITQHYRSYLSRRYPVLFAGTGVNNVEELLLRVQRVMQMFERILMNDQLQRWANFEWWLHEISELQEIPYAEAWKTAKQVAEEAEAEAQSEERKLLLAKAEAEVAKLTAEANRADADADSKRGKLSIERASTVQGLQNGLRRGGRRTGKGVGDE